MAERMYVIAIPEEVDLQSVCGLKWGSTQWIACRVIWELSVETSPMILFVDQEIGVKQ